MQLILEDYPAVVGPNYETEAVCLECLRRVDGSILCHHCNLPLCSEACRDGPLHRPECEAFRRREKKIKIAEYGRGTVAYEYGCIAVLRLLWNRDNRPDQWERLKYLMDHDEERRKEVDYWKMFQRNVVQFIRKGLGLQDMYSEEEINRAIGILRTNAFQIEHPYLQYQGTSGKAVYPTFSFMSHNCYNNGRYIVHPDNRLTLRAQREIKEGEEITIQYISFLFGNFKRCPDIKACWFFQCSCRRCEDPTELGTFLSAVLCQQCDGPVLPADSSLTCLSWTCLHCGLTVDREQVSSMVRELEDEMYKTEEQEYDKYCQLVERFSSLLHPHHYQLLLCKKYLAGSIRGNISLDMLEVKMLLWIMIVTMILLQRKVELMTEFVEVFQVVDPGLTKWRGKMLYQVHKTKMFLADLKHSNDMMDSKTFRRGKEQY